MLQKLPTSDQDLSLVQDNVDRALTPLQNVPMVGGNLLRGISLLSAQDNLIQHGLDHAPVVFFIGNQNVDTRVWSPTTATLSGASSNRTVINLRCSTTCVVSVWVN